MFTQFVNLNLTFYHIYLIDHGLLKKRVKIFYYGFPQKVHISQQNVFIAPIKLLRFVWVPKEMSVSHNFSGWLPLKGYYSVKISFLWLFEKAHFPTYMSCFHPFDLLEPISSLKWNHPHPYLWLSLISFNQSINITKKHSEAYLWLS